MNKKWRETYTVKETKEGKLENRQEQKGEDTIDKYTYPFNPLHSSSINHSHSSRSSSSSSHPGPPREPNISAMKGMTALRNRSSLTQRMNKRR